MKALAGKMSLVAVIYMAIHVGYYSLNQWRAERAYPIERSTLWTTLAKKIPDDQEIQRLQLAMKLSPAIDRYHVLLGRYFAYAPTNINVPSAERKILLRKAAREYWKALSINPTNTEVLAYLAWVDFSLGNYQEGLNKLEKAVELAPHNYFVRLNYGIYVLNFLDDIPKKFQGVFLYRAKQELNLGIRLNPTMARRTSVIGALANLYSREGNISGAVQQLEKVRNVSPAALPLVLHLVKLYLSRGEYDRAVRKYVELLDQEDIDARVRKKILQSLKQNARRYPGAVGLKDLMARYSSE